MDSKITNADGVTSSDPAVNPNPGPNEVNVDIAALQQEASANVDPNAPTEPAAEGSAPDTAFQTSSTPDEPTVAFTTDPSGNVQPVEPSETDSSAMPEASSDAAGATNDFSASSSESSTFAPTDSAAGNADSTAPTNESLAGPASEPEDMNPPFAATSGIVTPDASSTAPAPDASATPAAAPVPTPHSNKMMLIVLGAIAVVLLAAIVAMMFI
jgi:hypothetical protein